MHAETVKLTEISSLCRANYITIVLSFMCIGGKNRMWNRLQNKTHRTVKEPGKYVHVCLSILFQGGKRWEWVLCTRKVGRCSDARSGVAVLVHTDMKISFPSWELNGPPASLQS